MKKTIAINLSDWLTAARSELAKSTENPLLEAQMLLSHVLAKPRTWLISHSDTLLTSDQSVRLDQLVQACLKGEPLPYLLGVWPFFGLDFYVTTDVLIPRPETELLVEQALSWLENNPDRRLIVDVGTGSGCIAISLAANIPDLKIWGVDISPAALVVAERNVLRHHLENQVILKKSNLLESTSQSFDLICANLPYIPSGKLADLAVSHHEPLQALDGGEDGLLLIEQLLRQIPEHLNPGGLILLEIEAGQGESAYELAASLFPNFNIKILPDLAGLPRILRIESGLN